MDESAGDYNLWKINENPYNTKLSQYQNSKFPRFDRYIKIVTCRNKELFFQILYIISRLDVYNHNNQIEQLKIN